MSWILPGRKGSTAAMVGCHFPQVLARVVEIDNVDGAEEVTCYLG